MIEIYLTDNFKYITLVNYMEMLFSLTNENKLKTRAYVAVVESEN